MSYLNDTNTAACVRPLGWRYATRRRTMNQFPRSPSARSLSRLLFASLFLMMFGANVCWPQQVSSTQQFVLRNPTTTVGVSYSPTVVTKALPLDGNCRGGFIAPEGFPNLLAIFTPELQLTPGGKSFVADFLITGNTPGWPFLCPGTYSFQLNLQCGIPVNNQYPYTHFFPFVVTVTAGP